MSNLPLGRYVGRAASVVFPESEPGKEHAELTLEATEGEHAGGTIRKWLYFTDAAIEWSIKDLRALGWCGNDLTEIEDVATHLPNVVEFVIDERPDKKDPSKMRISVFINGGQTKPMAAPQKKSFAEKMRGRIAALDTKNGVPVAKAPPINNSDDIPF